MCTYVCMYVCMYECYMYMPQVDDSTDDKELGAIDMRGFNEQERRVRKESEVNWSRKGWSGKGWRGRYVGCPEAPDGSALGLFLFKLS